MNSNGLTSDGVLLRKYRVRITLFLVGVFVCLLLLNAVYGGINTIARLNVIEGERDQWQRLSDVVAELKLKDGDIVADVGSGAGYFALKLSHAVGPSGKVLAVDIRREPLIFLWIRTVLNGRHNVRELIGDPDDPHLPVGTINAVLIANTYHELANPESMLEHIFGSLRCGGRLVMLDRSSVLQDSTEEQNHRHEIPPERVEDQLRQTGFKILNRQDQFIDRPNRERWWLIAAQKAPQ